MDILKKPGLFLVVSLTLLGLLALLPIQVIASEAGNLPLLFSDDTLPARSASGEPLSLGRFASSSTDPTANIPWSCGFSGVDDIQCTFNNARATENTQLGTALPMITLPSQAAWNGMSDGEKALWLINRERSARDIEPLEQLESNVTGVAQNYADYLLENDAWGHYENGLSPLERLNENTTILDCHDNLSVAENLAVFVSSGTIPLPVVRSVYMWMYDDAGSGWGHRHAILWYPYNDNSGTSGAEGFLGIGRANGGPYQGPFSGSWPFAEMIVMNVFDPCSAWEYGSTTSSSTSPTTTTSASSSSTTSSAIPSTTTTSMDPGTSTSTPSTTTTPPGITTTTVHGTSTTPPETTTSITGCSLRIEPQSEHIASMQSLTFTVLSQGDCNDGDYEWLLETTIASSCNQEGNYTAGNNPDMRNPATDIITVVDHANDGSTAQASVDVLFACPSEHLYGDLSEEANLLRRFRDDVLSSTPEGKQLIELYYTWSPLVLKAMVEDEEFEDEIRKMLDGFLPMIKKSLR